MVQHGRHGAVRSKEKSMRALIMFFLRPIIAWREERIATHAAQTALALYHQLHNEQPVLSKLELYEEFVRRRNGIEAAGARKLLTLAEQSFAVWPTERALIFRDVVQYLVVTERLTSERTTTTADIALIVGRIIPSDL